MSNRYKDDLGFSFREWKSGDVVISHHGKIVTTLRSEKAISFIDNVQSASFTEQQQLMARLTGNYKRGNERPV